MNPSSEWLVRVLNGGIFYDREGLVGAGLELVYFTVIPGRSAAWRILKQKVGTLV